MEQGVDRAMAILRREAPANVLEYAFIMDQLRGYRSPRAKLRQLTKCGALVHVKRGFYVFGTPFLRGVYCKEALANMLYGPSYISLEWALQLYGMIPEGVEQITSVVYKKKKEFETPLGLFSYDHRPQAAYPSGVSHMVFGPYQTALVATPEKAVADLLILRRGKITSLRSLKEILFDDLRFEEEDIFVLDIVQLRKIHTSCPHSATHHLIKLVEENE